MGWIGRLIGARLAGRSASAAVLVIATALLAPAFAQAEELTYTFNPTGAEQSFVVPAGITSVHVVARGGRGAGNSRAAEVKGELSVTPSETLYIEVAGNGSGTSGGFNGGGEGGRGGGGGAPGQGGGGGTDIRTSPRSAGLSPDPRLLVAGGAGGGGSSSASNGGAAGQNGEGFLGGEAGTQTKGGEGGFVEACLLFQERPGKEFPGSPGSIGMGGNGAACLSAEHGSAAGGGGGGGYYGGGGGGADFEFESHVSEAGGGGGGSSLVPAGTTLALASASSEPTVEISFQSIGSAPNVTTEAATGVAKTGATLNGSVNPNGGEVSGCKFEYGTSTSYGSSAPCTPAPGSGTSPVAVSATVGGLMARTTYRFRVVASNAGGTTIGEDESFTTVPNAPTVETRGAASTATEATLKGQVDPNGAEVTECEFEYGTSISYGASAPCSPPPGSGTFAVNVSATVGGLTPSTKYFFHLVATNAGGTHSATGEFFTQDENSPPEFGRCVNGSSGAWTNSACTTSGAGRYEWFAAFGLHPLKLRGFTLAIKPTTKLLLEVKGGEKILCNGQTGSGEYATTKSLGNVTLTLTGCFKGVETDPCENTATSGEIVGNKLVAGLGILKESTEPTKVKVGLKFRPASGETIAVFSCASTTVTVNGSVIFEGKANAMESKITLKAEEAKGVEKWTHFVVGAANEDTLEVKLGAGSFTQSGLKLNSVQTNEEKVEANTLI